MKTTIKRRLTKGYSARKGSLTKNANVDGLREKGLRIANPKKQRCGHGLTAFWRANRRWRRALAYYVNTPGERRQPEMTTDTSTVSETAISEPAVEADFYTYETAPKVDRFGMPFNLAVVWASQLPGGLERLVCILMAIFLFLSILSVQIYVGTLNKHRIRCRLSFCEKPSTLEEVITFECRVTLLVVAWIVSMLVAWLLLACHFVYWCYTFNRSTSPLEEKKELSKELLDCIVTKREDEHKKDD